MAQGAWRIILTDLAGNAISDISGIAVSRQFSFTLNRPASFSFKARSDDARVASLYSDGSPYLSVLNRGIRCYRSERQGDGSYKNVLRFAGFVWQIEDVGDADVCNSAVVCYDPLQRLNRRVIRRMTQTTTNFTWSTVGADDAAYTWDVSTPMDGIAIAQALVDRANSMGWLGMSASISATAPAAGQSTPNAGTAASAQAIHFENQLTTAGIIQLSEAYNGFDFVCVPDESAVGSVKRFGYLSCATPAKGAKLTNVLLGYAIAPNNVQSISRVVDGENLCNQLIALGAGITANAVSTSSQASYGIMEDVVAWSDISVQALLNSLASMEVSLRKAGMQTVVIVPQPHASNPLLPWDNFNLGDTLTMNAGARLRGGFTGLGLRVYGFVLDADDDRGEVVSALLTSPESGVSL